MQRRLEQTVAVLFVLVRAPDSVRFEEAFFLRLGCDHTTTANAAASATDLTAATTANVATTATASVAATATADIAATANLGMAVGDHTTTRMGPPGT